jgi:hypothetical protein
LKFAILYYNIDRKNRLVNDMSVHIKSVDELKKMRIAGKLAAEVLEMIEPYVLAEYQLKN